MIKQYMAWLGAVLLLASSNAFANTGAVKHGVPRVSIHLEPVERTNSAKARLSWFASNAERCTAQGAWRGRKPVQGAQTISVAAGAVTYQIVCSNGAGSTLASTGSKEVNAEPQPGTVLAQATSGNPASWQLPAGRTDRTRSHLLKVKLESLGSRQALFSQGLPGYWPSTVLWASGTGHLVLRRHHEDGGPPTFIQSAQRLHAGRSHEIAIEFSEDDRLVLLLDGVAQGELQNASPVPGDRGAIFLGATCRGCSAKKLPRAKDIVQGEVALIAAPATDVLAAVGHSGASHSTEPGPHRGSPELNTSRVTRPTVVPFQSAMDAGRSEWRLDFRANRTGSAQALFSQDERGIDTEGHTTVWITEDGQVRLRHQRSRQDQIELLSRSRIRFGRSQQLRIAFEPDAGIFLWLNGRLEARSQKSFKGRGLRLPVVLGASCALCERNTTAPLSEPLTGWVQLRIHTLDPSTAVASQAADPTFTPSGPRKAGPEAPPNAKPEDLARRVPLSRHPAPAGSKAALGAGPSEPRGAQAADEPTLRFRSAANRIIAGESTTLRWQSSDAQRCLASGAWNGLLPTSGEREVRPRRTSSYAVTCYGATGAAKGLLAIEVQPVPTTKTVTLRWRAPAATVAGGPIRGLSGYRIHLGSSAGTYDRTIEIQGARTTSSSIELTPGQYFAAIQAIDNRRNLSDLSNEISFVHR